MLLEIVTRHIQGRPAMLAANMASVKALAKGAPDLVKQTILLDEVGRGVSWANAQLAEFEPVGDYVWLLDDDDVAIDMSLAWGLLEIAERQPDLIMMRMDHGPGIGILPDAWHWRKRPVMGQFGCSSFITDAAHWRRCRGAWNASYAADADFVRHAFDQTTAVEWRDVVASRCQRAKSNGAPE